MSIIIICYALAIIIITYLFIFITDISCNCYVPSRSVLRRLGVKDNVPASVYGTPNAAMSGEDARRL